MAKAIENLSATDDDAVSDALGLPRRYLGVVATGCGRAARANFSGFGNYECISWSPHIATERIITLRAVIGNWLVTENQDETLTGLGNSQQQIALEYPLGSARQIFPFGGTTAVKTVASGAEAESDALTLTVPIPKGALFRIGHWYSSPGGAILHALPTELPTTGIHAGFGCLFGPTVANTLAGAAAPTGLNNQYLLPPLALVAPTRRPSLLLLGDSRVDGAYDSWDQTFDVGELARTIGQAYGYINLGLFGDTLGRLSASCQMRAGLGRYCSGAGVMIGINDLSNNVSATTCIANMATLLAKLPANLAQRAICTVAPRPSSTDGWTTDANQTPNAFAAQIDAYNDAIRLGAISGQTHMFDVDDVVSSGRKSGRYRNLNGVPLTGDGVHMNQTGMQLVKRSGVVNLAAFLR